MTELAKASSGPPLINLLFSPPPRWKSDVQTDNGFNPIPDCHSFASSSQKI